jgi:hypothetical protein
MALIRSKLGSLAAAIGIGVAAEGLLFVGGLIISSPFRDPWGERIFALTREPAYHLVGWLAKVQRPGFEEQVGFVILVPLIQWVFWSAVAFWVLSRRVRSAAARTGTLKAP